MSSIRPISICVVRRGDALLGFDVHDSDGRHGFRPLGGGIDHGERSLEAVVREFREEIGAELTGGRLLGVLENIFTYRGAHGHEIVFVYEASLTDRSLYDCETFPAREDNDTPFEAIWRPLVEFRDGDVELYPEGLLTLLDSLT